MFVFLYYNIYIISCFTTMAENSASEAGFISRVFSELFGSPLNVGLLCICGFLLYKIFKGRGSSDPIPKKPELPKMKKRDFTLEQLREFDGKGPEGRILIAVNGKVFDVTRGKRFYGPGKHNQSNQSIFFSRVE